VLRAYILAISAATVICVIGFVIVQLFPAQLVSMFAPNGSAELMAFAPRAMRLMMLVLPVGGVMIISINFFVVTGRPKMSIFLSMLRQCIILIPCMLIFGRIWGIWGVVVATPVSDSLSLIIIIILISRELKKLKSKG
jgi:Na+-driven multidrug efflux pump